MTLYIVLGVILVVAAWFIITYNTLIKEKNQSIEGWSGIDVQLKRRHDLIPNLMASVKGYQQHESDVFEKVTQLRSEAINARGPGKQAQCESALSSGLGQMMAVVEQYPDLKASANFIDLQTTLANIEEQIQLARRYYNGIVRQFNTNIQSFPQNLFVKLMGFRAFDFFEMDSPQERQVPQVNFEDNNNLSTN